MNKYVCNIRPAIPLITVIFCFSILGPFSYKYLQINSGPEDNTEQKYMCIKSGFAPVPFARLPFMTLNNIRIYAGARGAGAGPSYYTCELEASGKQMRADTAISISGLCE